MSKKKPSFEDFTVDLIIPLVPSGIGIFFLLWMSSGFIWFISVLSVIAVVGIQFLVKLNTNLSDDDSIYFSGFAICLAAFIYFSAPWTDTEGYCSKQYYTTSTPVLTTDSRGRYTVKNKYTSSTGRKDCDSGTINLWLFVAYGAGTLYLLFKLLTITSELSPRKIRTSASKISKAKLNELTKPQLMKKAREQGVWVHTKMLKQEMIDEIYKAQKSKSKN